MKQCKEEQMQHIKQKMWEYVEEVSSREQNKLVDKDDIKKQ